MKSIALFVGNRLNEWVMVIFLFGLSLQLFFTTMDNSSTSLKFLLLFVRPQTVGLVYFLVAYARMVALIINGHSLVYGPHTRAVGALIGAVIWAQMEVSLVKIYISGVTTNTPGISLYFALVLGELFTVYRASTDVKSRPPL